MGIVSEVNPNGDEAIVPRPEAMLKAADEAVSYLSKHTRAMISTLRFIAKGEKHYNHLRVPITREDAMEAAQEVLKEVGAG